MRGWAYSHYLNFGRVSVWNGVNDWQFWSIRSIDYMYTYLMEMECKLFPLFSHCRMENSESCTPKVNIVFN